MSNDVTINLKARDAGAKAALTGGAQAGDQFAGSLRRAGDVARGVLAAGIIQDIGRQAQQFLGNAATAASGLEQAIGGTRAVFGVAAGAVDEFGKRSAQSVGLSEREFREATTLIGGQLKRMTGDVDLAAESSIQLVEIGADLAATYGGTTKEAVDAFSAALRGEADPAERFNLNLKITAVNAKAVELGLASSTSEVSEQAKAQALLALVLEQSADAHGQFAEEADTAAVAQQKARAEWENAQAVLGQALLPVIGELAGGVSTLASGFSALPDPVRNTAGGVALLSAGLLVLVPRIAATKIALMEMGLSARAATLSLGTVGVALAVLATVMATSSGEEERATFAADEFRTTLDQQTGAITDNTRELIRNKLEMEGILPAAESLGISSKDLIGALSGEKDALDRVNRALDDGKLKLANTDGEVLLSKELLAKWISELQIAQDELQGAANSTDQAGAAAAGATDDLAVLGEQFGFAGDEAADAAGKMLDAWGAASSDFISVGGVFERALDRKNAAEKRSSGSSGKSAEEVAEAHEDAAKRVEKASQAVERAKEDEARTIEGAAERVEQAEDRLADAQRAARDAQRALIDARREAADQLRELSDRIVDAELSEEAATLRLIRAGNQLAEVNRDRGASDLDRREAALAIAQARRNLAQVQEDLAALRSEEADAQRAGVEGSDLVQEALQRQREAAEGVIDAQEGVADAQRESARAMSDAAQRVADAQESMAEAAEDATKVIEDSAGGAGSAMRGLADDTTVTVDEYIAELDRMVREQEEWAQNLIDLSAKVPPAMLDELARLGPEGSAEVALLNSMSSAELDKVIGLFERKGRTSGRGFAENLAEAGPVLARVAKSQGRRTANQLAAEMLRSGDNVFEAAKRLGVFIDRGLGGDRSITVRVNEQIVRQHGVNAPQLRAHGGITGAEGSAQAGGIRGGLTLVGEQGPELARFAPGTMITPAASTRALLNGGGGGGPVDVRVSFDFLNADGEFARAIRKSIRVDNLLQANA